MTLRSCGDMGRKMGKASYPSLLFSRSRGSLYSPLVRRRCDTQQYRALLPWEKQAHFSQRICEPSAQSHSSTSGLQIFGCSNTQVPAQWCACRSALPLPGPSGPTKNSGLCDAAATPVRRLSHTGHQAICTWVSVMNLQPDLELFCRHSANRTLIKILHAGIQGCQGDESTASVAAPPPRVEHRRKRSMACTLAHAGGGLGLQRLCSNSAMALFALRAAAGRSC